MHHYVYEIKFSSGMKYIGVRSSKCLPHEDVKYLGSSKVIPPSEYLEYTKTIIEEFNSRPEAVAKEIELHALYNVKSNSEYYNQVNQTIEGFDAQGCTMATHKYLREKSANVRERGLSPKQQEWQEMRKGVKQGPNKEKANIGIDHPRTKPWYYITPDFKYHEVRTSIPDYFRTAENIPSALSERMVSYNISQRAHKPAIKGPMKGFTIGRLHDKPAYITQENLDLIVLLAGHTNISILRDLHKATSMGKNKCNDRDISGKFLNKTGQN